MANASNTAKILFVLNEETPMSSLDANRTTSMIARMTPPTPLLMIDVNEAALDAALDVNDDVSNIAFIADGFRQLELFITNFTTFYNTWRFPS